MKHVLAILAALGAAGAASAQPVSSPLPHENTQPPVAAVPQPQATVPIAHHMAAAAVPLEDGATAEFNAGMRRMMAGMDKPYTGDTDIDFAAHMVPHHQGAIDMAETELKFGHDPKMKQLAARIIAAQQREITFMQAWLAKHPAPPAATGPGAAQVK